MPNQRSPRVSSGHCGGGKWGGRFCGGLGLCVCMGVKFLEKTASLNSLQFFWTSKKKSTFIKSSVWGTSRWSKTEVWHSLPWKTEKPLSISYTESMEFPPNLFCYLYRHSITLLPNVKVKVMNHLVFWAFPCYMKSANSTNPSNSFSLTVPSATSAQRLGFHFWIFFFDFQNYHYQSHLIFF